MMEKPEKAYENPFLNKKTLLLTFPDNESEVTKQ